MLMLEEKWKPISACEEHGVSLLRRTNEMELTNVMNDVRASVLRAIALRVLSRYLGTSSIGSSAESMGEIVGCDGMKGEMTSSESTGVHGRTPLGSVRLRGE